MKMWASRLTPPDSTWFCPRDAEEAITAIRSGNCESLVLSSDLPRDQFGGLKVARVLAEEATHGRRRRFPWTLAEEDADTVVPLRAFLDVTEKHWTLQERGRAPGASSAAALAGDSGTPDWERLFKIGPQWFDRLDPRRSRMADGFAVGAGWYTLIEELLLLAESLGFTSDHFEVTQVKEKFGALRFYYRLSAAPDLSEAFNRAVRRAEAESTLVCEICGAPGSTVGKRGRHFGIRYGTWCARCVEDVEPPDARVVVG